MTDSNFRFTITWHVPAGGIIPNGGQAVCQPCYTVDGKGTTIPPTAISIEHTDPDTCAVVYGSWSPGGNQITIQNDGGQLIPANSLITTQGQLQQILPLTGNKS